MHHLGWFAAVVLLANITPGPNLMLIIATSLERGRSAGLRAVLGVAMGGLVHTLGAAVGLSALLHSSAALFRTLTTAGALYLACLGVLMIRGGGRDAASGGAPVATTDRIFLAALMTAALNPKVALFFLCLLPQFVEPSAGSAPCQLILLGLYFSASETVIDLCVALAASGIGAKARSRQLLSSVRRCVGGVLILLGVRMACRRPG